MNTNEELGRMLTKKKATAIF